jgi:hypothetical protein
MILEAQVRKAVSLAMALTIGALSPSAAQTSLSLLQSLPAAVQKQIENVRTACSEQLISEGEPDWVINPDDGLSLFTVSGRQAIMMVATIALLCLSEQGSRGVQTLSGKRVRPPLAGFVLGIRMNGRRGGRTSGSIRTLLSCPCRGRGRYADARCSPLRLREVLANASKGIPEG